jgi:hypothetical protein
MKKLLNVNEKPINHCRKKIPGLSYAVMSGGIELPVLDITHPMFLSAIDDKKLSEYLKEAEQKGEKRAESFQRIPAFIKRFFAKRSYIMADFFSEKKEDNFLSGLSTLLLKMGPDLIGGGRNRLFDRIASKGIGGMVLRMRLLEIARCQADLLIPQLKNSPGKDLCFINIAGGTTCDSINTLLLILNNDQEILKNRKIEINVLDIDPAGPDFAERSVMALKTGNGKFRDLNINFRYIHYDWQNTTELINLLSINKDRIKICSSEGGLFEYGADEIIIRNLNSISENSAADLKVVGSIMRDIDTIDAGALGAMKITTIKARMLGIEGLRTILEKTSWKMEKLIETNPRYLVFALKKRE